MPPDEEMDKCNVEDTYSGRLFSLKKVGHSDTGYNVDETWRRYVR